MPIDRLPRWGALLLSAGMILAGLALLFQAMIRLPTRAEPAQQTPATSGARTEPTATGPSVAAAETAPPAPTAAPTSTPTPLPALSLHSATGVPSQIAAALWQAEQSPVSEAASDPAEADFALNFQPGAGSFVQVYEQTFAASTRFDSLRQDVTFAEIQALWQQQSQTDPPFQAAVVLSQTLPGLEVLLGPVGGPVEAVADVDALIERVWADDSTLALLPFHLLTPELLPLAVDGQNPAENAAGFQADAYPLALPVYLADLRADASTADVRLSDVHAVVAEAIGTTNRDPQKLTLLVMTGVTAMVRETAYKMDTFGPEWVAEDIGPVLRAADITHVSNEVPFVPGCQTNRDPNNLIFCSAPEYMAALEAIGTDIVGLTGNHQNDYGPEDALASLDIYAEAGLPVYGGGRNKSEAFQPLYLEHNGTRFAFLGANSYGPPFAWAKDNAPGSAQFDLNILSATIRSIREKDLADVILVELQYQETYDVTPLWVQRQDFRALIQAGADVVTGVQSHVAQAVEFEEGRPILYGLGNLFFDQMWSDATRDGLIVKHTFYDGRHIATRLLPTILYDFGQPRWATGPDRERILRYVYGASYWERLGQ